MYVILKYCNFMLPIIRSLLDGDYFYKFKCVKLTSRNDLRFQNFMLLANSQDINANDILFNVKP